MNGPIFHKILYRLSKEQRKQFLGQEIQLDRAVHLQERVKIALGNLFYVCEGSNSSKIQLCDEDVDTLGNPGELNCFCRHCGRKTDYLQIGHIMPKTVQELVEVYEAPKRKELEGRIIDILTQLGEIPEEDSTCADGYFSMQVTLLLDELNGLLDQIVEKRFHHFGKLKVVHVKNRFRDLRIRYRMVLAFLFKNLP
ncbi:MAG: hypothetical protein JSU05_15125, partial [Bacteroidetes bacterium]|nr:hypothetical protein [Bacteroidota bacterium]